MLIAFLAGGHVLMEDMPGVGRRHSPWRFQGAGAEAAAGCSLRRMCCPLI
ncbi:MAG: hypothetical protein ACLR5S_05745 [Ruminococcus sp.]